MSCNHTDYTFEALVFLAILACFLFDGSPDLHDALICNLTHATECN